MKFYTGDHLGICKIIDVVNKKVEYRHGESSFNNPVININKIKLQHNIVSILKPKELTIYDYLNHIDCQTFNADKNSCFISSIYKENNNSSIILAAQDNGKIRHFSQLIDSNSDKNTVDYNEILSNENSFINYDKSLKLYKINNSSNKEEFYSLYENCPLRIFNIEKKAVSFKSKNVPNDELDLKVPIWDTDITEEINNNNVFYVSTAYGKIRTYDKRAKCQPIKDKVNFTNVSIKKINRLISVEEYYICIGDSCGKAILLDKRKGK